MAAEVILIDDRKDFLESMERGFSHYGMSLDCAQTWEEGVAQFRVGLHELVFADYDLPESKNGLKLLVRLKQLRPSSKLILVSGAITSVPEERIKSIRLVDDYLPKTPDILDKMITLTREALKRCRLPSDWSAVAQAHVAGTKIDEKEIEEIDLLLRQDISRS